MHTHTKMHTLKRKIFLCLLTFTVLKCYACILVGLWLHSSVRKGYLMSSVKYSTRDSCFLTVNYRLESGTTKGNFLSHLH